MRRSTSQNASSPSKNATHLMSTMSSATENNARVRSNTLSIKDKVESARRHLKSHQKQFHTGEDSSSGESVENRSPHHRSRSSPRDALTETAGQSKNKHTKSVLYSAELQHARRVSGEARKKTGPSRASAKSISPTRNNTSFYDQSLHELTMTSSPRRRSTFVVPGKKDSSFSLRGDATFTRRDTFTIDRRDDTTLSHDETVIAPGLLEEEFHPRRQRAHSSSAFHVRCTPKDAHPQEVSNIGKWDVDFLPGSLINARKVEKDRRSAAVDLLAPNAEAVRYQEERTRREEEELRRLVREQTNGRSTKEIFDSWVPLDEEKRKRKGSHTDDGAIAKKTTRRLWEAEDEREKEGGILEGLERRRGEEGEKRVVLEDEAGYAMPLPRDVDSRPMSTPPPPAPRVPTPEEQFFTPATSAPAPRLSRVSGVSGWRDDGETPILGRNSTRLSSTFVMDRTGIVDRSVHRLREPLDEADRSVGSSFHATPDRREESIEGGERSLGEYATPIGRRGEGRMTEDERSLLNVSHDRSRGALNESMYVFETNLNRSLDGLSALAARLTSQLEASRANLSAMAVPTASTPQRERGAGLEGAAAERRLGLEASILASLPPMGGTRLSAGADDLNRLMTEPSEQRRSLPNGGIREERQERVEKLTSPVPRARSTIPSPPPVPVSSSVHVSSVHGLASLLDANIGRMERSEEYEREACRLENVVHEINDTSINKTRIGEKEVVEKHPPHVHPSSNSSAPPIPPPRLRRPSREPPSRPSPPSASSIAAAPMLQLAIDNAGGRAELMEMYESRHRNWHRKASDNPLPAPLSPVSRSPSPVAPPFLVNPAVMRERQSVQGMLDQRAQAVRGTFLHLLQRLYRVRFERRYDDKKRDAVSERDFNEDQKREAEAFKREANEAKMKAVDRNIRYRDFMEWLKEETERMESEIKCEVERREMKRWEKKMSTEGHNESLLDSSRLLNASHLLDERARKAQRATDIARKHMEKREQVRRMEEEARRIVELAEAPSSARSSIIGDESFLLNQSRRHGKDRGPLRVLSARGGSPDESILNASRDVRSRDNSRVNADTSIGGGRMEVMSEMKERLEEKRRQAAEVTRAMEDSQRRMTETEIVSVAAQLAAHDEYIQGVERVGRVIAENAEPRSPTGLPPGVEPLDLSSLDEERKSTENSAQKSTGVSGKMAVQSSGLSRDSLDGVPPSIPSSAAPSTHPSTGTSHSKSTSSSSSSSNNTLRATEELSHLEEENALDEEKRESTVPTEEKRESTVPTEEKRESTVPTEEKRESTVPTEEKRESTVPTEEKRESTVPTEEKRESTVPTEEKREDPTVPLQFSPLTEGRNEELDRSLPSTAASTGRQEISLDAVLPRDTVTIPKTTSPEETVAMPSTPIEYPQVPVHSVDTALDEQESIREEIAEDMVARSTVPSRALFSPIESSTSSSEESETSSDRGGKSAVVQRKESTGESTGSSEETEEQTLDVSTTSLKKAISVASEMANPFDGFESSSEGSRGSERKQQEVLTHAVAPSNTSTSISLDQMTVVERSPAMRVEEEEDEISWGDGGAGGGLEVGGGSARSEDFDWGMSTEEGVVGIEKKEEMKDTKKEEVEKEEESREKETIRPTGKLASLRDRLNKINTENEEEEKKGSGKTSTASSSTTASSSARSSSSSKTTSTEKSTSEESESKKEEEEEEEEKTPRATSVSDAFSSASGSINFDDGVDLPTVANASARTPCMSPRSRFRLSLDESLAESPRDAALKSSPRNNGRILGLVSPRRTITPTSPRTPRALTPSHLSPSGTASPEWKRNRYSSVMPMSPLSGRRSASPRNISLSRELSFAQDDSSFGDISKLSPVELPSTSGGMSGLSPMLPSLPPLVSPARPSLLTTTRPSIGSLNGSSIEEGDELDESVYDLMDVKTPVGSVLSSLPVSDLIGYKNEDEVSPSPPLTVSARSNGSLHELCQTLNKREFIVSRIESEVDEIWKVVEKKGSFSAEDVGGFADKELEKGTIETVTLKNERISIIRGISSQVAVDFIQRDKRRIKDGRSIPKAIIPLRKFTPPLSKERLRSAIEKEMQQVLQPQKAAPSTTRMRALGVDVSNLDSEQRMAYAIQFAHEAQLVQSDVERNDIVENLMRL